MCVCVCVCVCVCTHVFACINVRDRVRRKDRLQCKQPSKDKKHILSDPPILACNTVTLHIILTH